MTLQPANPPYKVYSLSTGQMLFYHFFRESFQPEQYSFIHHFTGNDLKIEKIDKRTREIWV